MSDLQNVTPEEAMELTNSLLSDLEVSSGYEDDPIGSQQGGGRPKALTTVRLLYHFALILLQPNKRKQETDEGQDGAAASRQSKRGRQEEPEVDVLVSMDQDDDNIDISASQRSIDSIPCTPDSQIPKSRGPTGNTSGPSSPVAEHQAVTATRNRLHKSKPATIAPPAPNSSWQERKPQIQPSAIDPDDMDCVETTAAATIQPEESKTKELDAPMEITPGSITLTQGLTDLTAESSEPEMALEAAKESIDAATKTTPSRKKGFGQLSQLLLTGLTQETDTETQEEETSQETDQEEVSWFFCCLLQLTCHTDP